MKSMRVASYIRHPTDGSMPHALRPWNWHTTICYANFPYSFWAESHAWHAAILLEDLRYNMMGHRNWLHLDRPAWSESWVFGLQGLALETCYALRGICRPYFAQIQSVDYEERSDLHVSWN